jgi:hypothetical protein
VPHRHECSPCEGPERESARWPGISTNDARSTTHNNAWVDAAPIREFEAKHKKLRLSMHAAWQPAHACASVAPCEVGW